MCSPDMSACSWCARACLGDNACVRKYGHTVCVLCARRSGGMWHCVCVRWRREGDRACSGDVGPTFRINSRGRSEMWWKLSKDTRSAAQMETAFARNLPNQRHGPAVITHKSAQSAPCGQGQSLCAALGCSRFSSSPFPPQSLGSRGGGSGSSLPPTPGKAKTHSPRFRLLGSVPPFS